MQIRTTDRVLYSALPNVLFIHFHKRTSRACISRCNGAFARLARLLGAKPHPMNFASDYETTPEAFARLRKARQSTGWWSVGGSLLRSTLSFVAADSISGRRAAGPLIRPSRSLEVSHPIDTTGSSIECVDCSLIRKYSSSGPRAEYFRARTTSSRPSSKIWKF